MHISTSFAQKNAPSKNDYILIINSYTETTPWSSSIIDPIIQMASKNQKLDIYIEHMNMFVVNKQEELNEFTEFLFFRIFGKTSQTFSRGREFCFTPERRNPK